jgi:hypothetical protein
MLSFFNPNIQHFKSLRLIDINEPFPRITPSILPPALLTATDIQNWIDNEPSVELISGFYELDKVIHIHKPMKFRGQGSKATELRPTFDRHQGTILLIGPKIPGLEIISFNGETAARFPRWKKNTDGIETAGVHDDLWMEVGFPPLPIVFDYEPQDPDDNEVHAILSGPFSIRYSSYTKRLYLDELEHPAEILQGDFNHIIIGTIDWNINGIAQAYPTENWLRYPTDESLILGLDNYRGLPGPCGYIKGLGLNLESTYGLVTPTSHYFDAIVRRNRYEANCDDCIIEGLHFSSGSKAIQAFNSPRLLAENLTCHYQSGRASIELDNNCYISTLRKLYLLGGGIKIWNASGGTSLHDSWISGRKHLVELLSCSAFIHNSMFDCTSSTKHAIYAKGEGSVGMQNLHLNCVMISDESSLYVPESLGPDSFLYLDKYRELSMDGVTFVRCKEYTNNMYTPPMKRYPALFDIRGDCVVTGNYDVKTYI